MSNRNFRFALQRAKAREATLHGRQYTVVPVVMLREGVIHASNADDPELVLASEFSLRTSLWNGRPVLLDHPVVDGEAVSANSPKILEGRQLGFVYNVRAAGESLKGEIWLDHELVAKAGADVLTRLASGEILDVSVGVAVNPEPKAGSFHGSSYSTVWRSISPDHLAIMPAGVAGACSLEMGCGAGRAASEARNCIIKKEKGKFVLYTSDGSRKLGTHPTRAKAEAQEQAIDMAKQKQAAEQSTKSRNELSDSDFAAVWTDADGNKQRKLPIHDKAHADNAAARLNQTDMPADMKAKARKKIEAAQKRFGETKNAGGRMKVKDILTSLAARFTTAAESEDSLSSEDGINDLRNDLWNQLYAAVPAFSGIVDIFPQSMKVIYSKMEISEDGPSLSCLYQVSYSMNGDEPVLEDDHVEVEQVTEYEPVGSEEGEEAMTVAASTLSRAAAGYGAMAKKADASSTAAQEASEAVGKDGTPEAHDSAADAHTDAALMHGQAALAAKKDGNTTAQAAHMDKKAEHEAMSAEHSDKAIAAKKETKPEPGEAGAKKTASANGCGCGKSNTRAASGENMTKKEIVTRILSHSTSPFKAEDSAVLEQLSEARLNEIEARCASEAKPAAAASAAPTKEQMFETFPEVKQIVEERQASDARRRSELVSQLKTLGAFTEDELKAMPIDQLEKTAKLAASRTPMTLKPKVDFSGLGASRGASADPTKVPAPPSLKDAIRSARGMKIVPKTDEQAS